jgi:glutathione synthase
MGYITTTHILDMIHPNTLVVNDPFLGAELSQRCWTWFPRTQHTHDDRSRFGRKSFRHGDVARGLVFSS